MPPDIADNPDLKQLRLLSIFYYILAGLSAFAGCIVMGFALVGVAVMAGIVEGLPQEAALFLGLLLAVIEGALGLFVLTMSVLELTTGRSLAARKHYRFCFVMSCIELINIPVGTTLAVFTIVVLSRRSVRELFEGHARTDRRLEALDEFDDADEPAPVPSGPKKAADESIKE